MVQILSCIYIYYIHIHIRVHIHIHVHNHIYFTYYTYYHTIHIIHIHIHNQIYIYIYNQIYLQWFITQIDSLAIAPPATPRRGFRGFHRSFERHGRERGGPGPWGPAKRLEFPVENLHEQCSKLLLSLANDGKPYELYIYMIGISYNVRPPNDS